MSIHHFCPKLNEMLLMVIKHQSRHLISLHFQFWPTVSYVFAFFFHKDIYRNNLKYWDR